MMPFVATLRLLGPAMSADRLPAHLAGKHREGWERNKKTTLSQMAAGGEEERKEEKRAEAGEPKDLAAHRTDTVRPQSSGNT